MLKDGMTYMHEHTTIDLSKVKTMRIVSWMYFLKPSENLKVYTKRAYGILLMLRILEWGEILHTSKKLQKKQALILSFQLVSIKILLPDPCVS